MEHNSLEMKVAVITHDRETNSPVLILKNDEEGSLLPIWIGPYEAYAIMMEIEGIEAPRPMTHDLLKNAIAALGADLEYVEIFDLSENTFFSQLILTTEAETITIDARPSDAVALALRCNSNIYVSRDVIEAGGAREGDKGTKLDKESINEMLKNLKPSDFEGEEH
ncbi:MAG: bifunctional nuclease family protein [bacterium]|nr:bifunctional nuclease family protein [bacterium]